VHSGQLEHLTKLAELPTVTIQVLRPEEGVHAVQATGGFTLLSLDAVSQVGYVEPLDDAVYLYDRDQIQALAAPTTAVEETKPFPGRRTSARTRKPG